MLAAIGSVLREAGVLIGPWATMWKQLTSSCTTTSPHKTTNPKPVSTVYPGLCCCSTPNLESEVTPNL